MARIFISYSRADRQFVDDLVPLLRRVYGHDSLWYDDDIHGGADWWHMILSEIAACELFDYLISNDSLASPYCQAEMREALRLRKQILPVIVRPKTDYPGVVADDLKRILQDTQYVDMARGVKDTNALTLLYASANRLLAQVPSQPQTPLTAHPVSPPPVPDRPQKPRPRAYWVIGAVVALLVIVMIVVALLRSVEEGRKITPEATRTLIAAVGTGTETPAPSPTATLTATQTLTVTPAPTATPTLSATELEKTIAAEMDFAETENVQTLSSFQTQTSAALTATAILWTATPTPDLRATAYARLTETQDALIGLATENAGATVTQFSRDQTARATSWTATPTSTDTPTSTLTPTPTATETFPATANSTLDLVQEALEIARNFSGGNDDWKQHQFVGEFNGVQMVLVPAGCFMMGSDSGDSDERPVRRVCFDAPFWIDRTEVTNAQYGSSGAFSGANRPRESVTWTEAQLFCVSRFARLPTEAEWEYAARGPDAWVYPWGNDFDGNMVIWNRSLGEGPALVGSKPEGASWVGAVDMSGNVWEWVADWYEIGYYSPPNDVTNPTGPEYGEGRVNRGGSWLHSNAYGLRTADRNRSTPDYRGYNLGFRCARSQ